MKRLTPALAILGVVLLGCAGNNQPDRPAEPGPVPSTGAAHQATIEVKGMV